MQKILALISTAILIAFGMMFSAVALVFILTIGLTGFAYLWWKTRAVRKLMREQNQAANDSEPFKDNDFKGEIIEGEIIRKVVAIDTKERPH